MIHGFVMVFCRYFYSVVLALVPHGSLDYPHILEYRIIAQTISIRSIRRTPGWAEVTGWSRVVGLLTAYSAIRSAKRDCVRVLYVYRS